MNKKPLISVIVPVHNAARTLPRMLESLYRQTLNDFEVLLIENGSVDDSLEICNEAASSDGRFRVFDIGPCNGPSTPRNKGLDEAAGEYIFFLDSDDWIEDDALETASAHLQKADVVFYGYFRENATGDAGICVPSDNAADVSNRVLAFRLYEEDLFGYTWSKALSRRIIGNTKFSAALKLGEDELFALEIMKKDPVVTCISQPLYHYAADEEEGLTRRTLDNYVVIQETLFCAWRDFLEDSNEEVLSRMAEQRLHNCHYYMYERELPLLSNVRVLRLSSMLDYADKNGNSFVAAVRKGDVAVMFHWARWKVKMQAWKLLNR